MTKPHYKVLLEWIFLCVILELATPCPHYMEESNKGIVQMITFSVTQKKVWNRFSSIIIWVNWSVCVLSVRLRGGIHRCRSRGRSFLHGRRKMSYWSVWIRTRFSSSVGWLGRTMICVTDILLTNFSFSLLFLTSLHVWINVTLGAGKPLRFLSLSWIISSRLGGRIEWPTLCALSHAESLPSLWRPEWPRNEQRPWVTLQATRSGWRPSG